MTKGSKKFSDLEKEGNRHFEESAEFGRCFSIKGHVYCKSLKVEASEKKSEWHTEQNSIFHVPFDFFDRIFYATPDIIWQWLLS